MKQNCFIRDDQIVLHTVKSRVGDSLMAPKHPKDAIRKIISPVMIRTMGGAVTLPSTK